MIRRLDNNDFLENLKEAERFHMGVGKVYETLRALVNDFESIGVDYALVGAMALNAHGYRRETVDLDILVRRDGLERFCEELVGRGYRPAFEGAKKSFRSTHTGVSVEFLTTGEYPGDGRPKPVVFPDPADVAVEMDGIRVVSLPTLVNLKLASGMSLASRRRDLADVQDLIRTLGLSGNFAQDLDSSVREMFLTLLGELGEADPHAEGSSA